MTAAAVVFALSYLVIAGTRVPFVKLDRPAGAMLGAVAMVLLGVVTPAEALRDGIHHETLALLLGMMIVTAYMADAALFRWTSWLTLTHVRSPRGLLVALVFVSGLSSALLVNDTICLMLTPLVVQLTVDARLSPTPYLLALAFGSNAGSLATPTGNPQNMLVATLSSLDWLRFTGALALPALASLCVLALVLVLLFRNELPSRRLVDVRLPPPPLDRRLALLCLLALAGLVAAFVLGHDLAWSALAAASFLVLAAGRSPRQAFERVDWVLLLFFAGLFVIVHGVGRAGLAQAMFDGLRPLLGTTAETQSLTFGVFTVVASQIVSNVPFVVLAGTWMDAFADPAWMWLSTALFSTLAGNLTPVGSVANLIVLEGAGEHGRIPFGRFVKAGALVTVTTIAAAWSVLALQRWLGWL